MADVVTDPLLTPDALVAAPAADNYLTHTRGFRSWVFTLDHKRIGVMYMVGIFAAFLLGGIFALLVRTELLWSARVPEQTLMGALARLAGPKYTPADMYNHMFTLHGTVMIFLFIIPSVPAILGNFMLPLMLGAKDVAFPRLNLASFYLWVVGAIFFVVVLHTGGLDTGWRFYVPYSTDASGSQGAVVWAVCGAFVLGFSSIFTGINFIVTVHKLRPAGMKWFRMPLFVWASTPRRWCRCWPRPSWGSPSYYWAWNGRFPSISSGPHTVTHSCTSTSFGSTPTRRSTS